MDEKLLTLAHETVLSPSAREAFIFYCHLIFHLLLNSKSVSSGFLKPFGGTFINTVAATELLVKSFFAKSTSVVFQPRK